MQVVLFVLECVNNMPFGHNLILQELMLIKKPSLQEAYMCYLEVVFTNLLNNDNSTNEIGNFFCFSLAYILLIIHKSYSLITICMLPVLSCLARPILHLFS